MLIKNSFSFFTLIVSMFFFAISVHADSAPIVSNFSASSNSNGMVTGSITTSHATSSLSQLRIHYCNSNRYNCGEQYVTLTKSTGTRSFSFDASQYAGQTVYYKAEVVSNAGTKTLPAPNGTVSIPSADVAPIVSNFSASSNSSGMVTGSITTSHATSSLSQLRIHYCNSNRYNCGEQYVTLTKSTGTRSFSFDASQYAGQTVYYKAEVISNEGTKTLPLPNGSVSIPSADSAPIVSNFSASSNSSGMVTGSITTSHATSSLSQLRIHYCNSNRYNCGEQYVTLTKSTGTRSFSFDASQYAGQTVYYKAEVISNEGTKTLPLPNGSVSIPSADSAPIVSNFSASSNNSGMVTGSITTSHATSSLSQLRIHYCNSNRYNCGEQYVTLTKSTGTRSFSFDASQYAGQTVYYKAEVVSNAGTKTLPAPNGTVSIPSADVAPIVSNFSASSNSSGMVTGSITTSHATSSLSQLRIHYCNSNRYNCGEQYVTLTKSTGTRSFSFDASQYAGQTVYYKAEVISNEGTQTLPAPNGTVPVSKNNSFSLDIITENGSVIGEGINCPSDCTELYAQESASNTLTATPNSGYKFNIWNLGGNCSSTNVLTQTTINITLSGDCIATANFDVISSNEIYLKIVDEQPNIPLCQNYTNAKYCVPTEKEISLKLEVTDLSNNLKQIEINIDGGNETPKVISPSDINNGIATITLNYGSAKYFPNANQDNWTKNITFSATAIDKQNNTSDTDSLLLRLYHYGTLEEINAEQNRLAAEKNLLEQEQSNDKSDLEEESLTCSEMKYPQGSGILQSFDPMVYSKGEPIQCSPIRTTQRPGVENGIAPYSSKIIVNFQDNYMNIEGCINYPATVIGEYIVEGKKYYYPDEEGIIVKNYKDKELAIDYVHLGLNDEIKDIDGVGLAGVCKASDVSEFTHAKWVEFIRSSEEFNSTVDKIYATYTDSGIDKAELANSIANGAAKAAKEITLGYKNLVTETPKAAINVAKKVAAASLRGLWAIASSSYTVDDLIEQAKQLQGQTEDIKNLVIEIADSIAETVPLLPDAIKNWSPENKAYFMAYISTHIAHEFAPTSKLKLLKMAKTKKIPLWLTKAVLLVRFKGAGFPLNNQILKKLSSEQIEVLSYTLKGKKSHKQAKYNDYDEPFIDDDLDIIAQTLGKCPINASSKNRAYAKSRECKISAQEQAKFWVKMINGVKFNTTRNKYYKHEEIYICKPTACNDLGEAIIADKSKAYVRLDSYNSTIPKVIVSRKYTYFNGVNKVSVETAKKYVDELVNKYPPGRRIASVCSNLSDCDKPLKNNRNKGLAGKELTGDLVLEVPEQDIPDWLFKYALDKKPAVNIITVPK